MKLELGASRPVADGVASLVPFNQLQAQSIASLATSLSGMTSTLQMALEPFHGGPILYVAFLRGFSPDMVS